MSAFGPMPNLMNTEDNFELAENADNQPKAPKDVAGCADHGNDEIAVVTRTSSTSHCINWEIDSRSLYVAKLAPKGDKRGVIEANVQRGGDTFKLELCASGWRNSQDGYCAFYLTAADQDDLFVARYRVQVGDITRISSIRHDFHLGVGFPNFCEQATLEGIVTGGELRFLVTVEVFSCESKVKPPARPLTMSASQKPANVCLGLMGKMFRERLHADVHLVCQERRLPVHKCVLAHASPVFRAMFAHNLLESTSREVHMHDFEPRVVEAMVEFLYVAKISLPSANPATEGACPAGEPSDGSTPMDLDDVRDELSPSGAAGAVDTRVELPDEGAVAAPSAAPLSRPATTTSPEEEKESACTATGPPATDDAIFQLFQLAEMYKMESLVIACCQQMHDSLTPATACVLLTRIQRYAHVPEIAVIKESIWGFVTEHIKQVKRTAGFQRLFVDHPQLVGELIDKMSC